MLEKITEIIREYTANKELTLTEDTMILTDIGINSFDLVQIVCIVEETFGVSVPDSDIEKFKTVGDLINYIEAQQ